MFRIFAIICVTIFTKLFYRHKVYGKSNLPKTGAIYAANHSSFLDPPLLGISCPNRIINFLARASLYHNPILGWMLRALYTYPIKKGEGNIGTFRQALELLKEGKNLALFPEGTRSEDGKLQKALPGVSLLVIRSEALVVPVYLHGTFGIWNRFHKKPKIWTKEKTACVFGKPLDFRNFKGDKKELQQLIPIQIMEAIGQLQQWYLDGAKGTPP